MTNALLPVLTHDTQDDESNMGEIREVLGLVNRVYLSFDPSFGPLARG